MRYPTSEKLEIIRIVEQSHLPAKKTLDQLGIARRTFYRWYDRYLEGGPEALEDRPSRPIRVWNRISAEVQSQIVDMALEQSELSPRELAVRFTDEKRYFVSEATVYRLLKAHGLITSPAFVVIKADDEFRDKTARPNEMWQTDFTYFKIIGWGWVYLSTVLDDFSRYIIAWKLCTTMRAEDVTDTLELALTASGCDSAKVLLLRNCAATIFRSSTTCRVWAKICRTISISAWHGNLGIPTCSASACAVRLTWSSISLPGAGTGPA